MTREDILAVIGVVLVMALLLWCRAILQKKYPRPNYKPWYVFLLVLYIKSIMHIFKHMVKTEVVVPWLRQMLRINFRRPKQ